MILSPEQEEILADFDKYMDKIKVKAREALTERKPLKAQDGYSSRHCCVTVKYFQLLVACCFISSSKMAQ